MLRCQESFLAILAFIACVVHCGCDNGPVVIETRVPEVQQRLMAVRSAYASFLEQNGRPPENETELRSTFNQSEVDKLLTSPRDGKPFNVCYGIDIYSNLDWAKDVAVVAYEQEGESNTRWVLAAPGAIFELSQEDFKQASFPPGHAIP